MEDFNAFIYNIFLSGHEQRQGPRALREVGTLIWRRITRRYRAAQHSFGIHHPRCIEGNSHRTLRLERTLFRYFQRTIDQLTHRNIRGHRLLVHQKRDREEIDRSQMVLLKWWIWNWKVYVRMPSKRRVHKRSRTKIILADAPGLYSISTHHDRFGANPSPFHLHSHKQHHCQLGHSDWSRCQSFLLLSGISRYDSLYLASAARQK